MRALLRRFLLPVGGTAPDGGTAGGAAAAGDRDAARRRAGADRNTVQGPADGQVLALATGPARDGVEVLASAGAPVGGAVRVWVDARGDVTGRPLPASDISAPIGYFTRPDIVYRSRDPHLGNRPTPRGWERVDSSRR